MGEIVSRQIQIRRGTAAEHATFTGKIGEITMDTTNNTIRVHDGQTPGGTPLAKQSEIPNITTFKDILSLFLPDYSNGNNMTFPFTAPCDCMCYAATTNAVVKVNDEEVAYFGVSGSSSGANGLKWFMAAGDVATVASGSVVRSKYYPLKYTEA